MEVEAIQCSLIKICRLLLASFIVNEEADRIICFSKSLRPFSNIFFQFIGIWWENVKGIEPAIDPRKVAQRLIGKENPKLGEIAVKKELTHEYRVRCDG